jgi:hypothetical protein
LLCARFSILSMSSARSTSPTSKLAWLKTVGLDPLKGRSHEILNSAQIISEWD